MWGELLATRPETTSAAAHDRRPHKRTGTMEGLIIGGIAVLIICGLIAIWPDIEDVIDDLNDQGRD